MTAGSTRSASRRHLPRNAGDGVKSKDGLTLVRESGFMVDIAGGAVAKRFDSGYDESVPYLISSA